VKGWSFDVRHACTRARLAAIQGSVVLLLSAGSQAVAAPANAALRPATASAHSASGPAPADGSASRGATGTTDSAARPAAGPTVSPPQLSPPVHGATSTPAAATPIKQGTGPATSSGVQRLPVNSVRAINYFPAHHGWTDMWTQWDPTAIDNDFKRIAWLHANTVRIILDSYSWSFGWPAPRSVMMSHLSDMITLAANHGLYAQITLFDQFTSFSDVAGSKAWARQVLAPFAGDPRVAFVELQNEVDPRIPAQVSWVRQMLPYLRSISGGIPVTVSVCGCDSAAALASLKAQVGSSQPDFWDFHFYAEPAQAFGVFRDAKAAAAPLPLLIGETGYSTHMNNSVIPGVPWTVAAQEAYQDQFYRTVANAAAQAGIPPVAPWMLNDIADLNCAPRCTQTTGIFRADGSPKPAAWAVMRMYYGVAQVTDLNNSFEQDAGGYPAYWRLWGQGSAAFARDATVSHSGSASARLNATTTVPGGTAPSFYTAPVDGTVPGHTYSLSAWVRGSAATGSTVVAIGFFDSHGTWLGQAVSAQMAHGDSAWTQLTASGVAPPGTVSRVVYLESANNSGSAWFDDISFS
jgi:hypothetical protein